MAHGTSAILHINRLKKAYDSGKGESVLPLCNKLREKVKLKEFNKFAPTGNNEIKAVKLDAAIHSPSLVRGIEIK